MRSSLKIPTVSMNGNIEYLLGFLEDELRDLSGLRIHAVAPTGRRKSPDLPQESDPESPPVSFSTGVRVRVQSREYHFPEDWVAQGRFDAVKALAEEIRAYCKGGYP